jgi:hypothetical protein
LTRIKVGTATPAEIVAKTLIIGATIDTLLAGARQAIMKEKVPRGVEVA